MGDQPKLENISKPSEILISELEIMLEQAKKGELTGMAYVLVNREVGVKSGFADIPGKMVRTVVGELEIAKSRLVQLFTAQTVAEGK